MKVDECWGCKNLLPVEKSHHLCKIHMNRYKEPQLIENVKECDKKPKGKRTKGKFSTYDIYGD